MKGEVFCLIDPCLFLINMVVVLYEGFMQPYLLKVTTWLMPEGPAIASEVILNPGSVDPKHASYLTYKLP